MSSDEEPDKETEDNVFDRPDLERVGQFVDGPYDNEVILFRPDIQTVMGRDNDVKDDEKRLDGPWIPPPGFKIVAAPNDWLTGGPSPFLYLWEDEPYDDPGAWRRRYKAEQKELDINEKPFNSSFGSKTMNGLGTYYGTFWSFMEEPLEVFNPPLCSIDPEDDKNRDDRLKGVPNFVTSPGKEGGYGYNDICLNPFPEWMEDPLFDLTEARRIMREEFEAAMVGGIWIPTAHPGDFFDPNPYFDSADPDGTTETYDWDRLLPAAGWEDLVPWMPNTFTKQINGNKDVIDPLERFPSYDPSDEYADPKEDVFRPYDHDPELKPWMPQFGTQFGNNWRGNRSRQQCSTVKYCINLWVNPMTFHRRFY